MQIAFAVFVLVHGLIHFIGVAKAFGFAAKLPMSLPISAGWGTVWLLAALLWITTSVMLFQSSARWWIPASVALLASQVVIIMSFADAKWGTLANLVVLVPLAVSLLDQRHASLQSIYKRECEARRTRALVSFVGESEIAHLPPQVQRYLRVTKSVGNARVRSFHARMRGTLRNSPDAPWMNVDVVQENFFDTPARIFFVRGARFGVPFDALHTYIGEAATMRVMVASVFEAFRASGHEMNQSETVTMFNDMCLFAPATLIDPNIRWEEIDAHSVRAWFRHGPVTISAVLTFNERGELVGFVSHDRYQSVDGKTFTLYPWSTPVERYGEFNGRHLVASATASWNMHGTEFPYARLELVDLEYNAARP